VNLGQVVFGDLAELRRTDEQTMLDLFYRRLIQIASLGTAAIVAMDLLVPLMLPQMFGARWARASEYFLLLSPMLLANFISAPFGFVVDVLRRQDLHLLRDSLRTLIMVIALQIALATTASWRGALSWMSAAGVLNGVVYLAVSWYALTHRARERERDIALTAPELPQDA
jgi:O-antigen/teichoic acid export membrane protein